MYWLLYGNLKSNMQLYAAWYHKPLSSSSSDAGVHVVVSGENAIVCVNDKKSNPNALRYARSNLLKAWEITVH